CGNTIVTTREAFENIRVRQRHNSLGTLLGEAIRDLSQIVALQASGPHASTPMLERKRCASNRATNQHTARGDNKVT
ncbi:hypothetical protein CN165_29165, partial [Sinorhizobium medicae]